MVDPFALVALVSGGAIGGLCRRAERSNAEGTVVCAFRFAGASSGASARRRHCKCFAVITCVGVLAHSQCRGREFDPPPLHIKPVVRTGFLFALISVSRLIVVVCERSKFHKAWSALSPGRIRGRIIGWIWADLSL